MNLYLVLAIALGAVSGVVQAPVTRPAMVTQREVRAQRRAIRTTVQIVNVRSGATGRVGLRPEARAPRPHGASRPRAPALG